MTYTAVLKVLAIWAIKLVGLAGLVLLAFVLFGTVVVLLSFYFKKLRMQLLRHELSTRRQLSSAAWFCSETIRHNRHLKSVNRKLRDENAQLKITNEYLMSYQRSQRLVAELENGKGERTTIFAQNERNK